MKSSFIALIGAFVLTQHAYAGDGFVYGAVIETVAAVGPQHESHLAGNMEIKIQGGFNPPAGVSCDGTYITTRKDVDRDGALLSLAKDARNAQRPVILVITDNPAYTAYPGRCSLISIAE